jgi:hypothetical protein
LNWDARLVNTYEAIYRRQIDEDKDMRLAVARLGVLQGKRRRATRAFTTD